MHVSFCISVFIFVFKTQEWNCCTVGSTFRFLSNLHIISIVIAPIYIPMNSIGKFLFLHILTNICYLCSFWWYSFWQMWGDISVWFWFAFPWWLTVLHIFPCACWPLACPVWKNVYAGLLSIFQLGLLLGCCMSCLCILDVQWVFSFLASSGDCPLLVFIAFIDCIIWISTFIFIWHSHVCFCLHMTIFLHRY